MSEAQSTERTTKLRKTRAIPTLEERRFGPPEQCRHCGRDGRDWCDATGDYVRVDDGHCDECGSWLDTEREPIPASARVRPSRWDSEEVAVARFESERDYAEWRAAQ